MADTVVLLNGFSIIGGANTNVSQTGQGQLKIHSGDALFDDDDIVAVYATNVSETGEFSYDTIITQIVVYDSAADYFNDVVKYTYTPVSGSSGAVIDPGKHGNWGMGDRYLQLEASELESSDPGAPALSEMVMTPGIDLVDAMENNTLINVDTVEDVDYSGNGTIEGSEFGNGSFGSVLNVFSGVVCFARGTLIETDTGPLPIECLRAGDMVQTLDNDLQPIRWIGSTVAVGRGKNVPIRIRAGALGNVRHLIVSPNHRVLVTGAKAQLLFGEDQVLVAAKHLVDGDLIREVPCDRVEYFHYLFDRHEIVFAEACPAESLHPGKESLNIISREARQEILATFPELADPGHERELSRFTLKSHEVEQLLRLA
jgi:hypothetical protein